ncbi:MAG: PAS domain S-box protein, partial [Proteobacteria bacterium]|nr:PAS domain S-box protein [Pseudomonadota bacterium]
MSGTKKDVRDIEPKQFRKNPVNETLKTAWDFSRHLIDSSLDMIVAVDQDRRIVEFNKAAQEAFGYRPEEILGRPVDVLYADMEESREVSLEVARNGSLVREITNIRKNGEPFPCLLSAAMIRDENGRVIGVVGNSRDETERKRAAEALQNYSKRLGELVETRTTALKTANEELHREIAERRRTETALREAEVRLIRHRDELEDAVAQRTLELEEKNHALQVQAQKLSEMNAALGILFEQRDTDRQELEKTLMQNIR